MLQWMILHKKFYEPLEGSYTLAFFLLFRKREFPVISLSQNESFTISSLHITLNIYIYKCICPLENIIITYNSQQLLQMAEITRLIPILKTRKKQHWDYHYIINIHIRTCSQFSSLAIIDFKSRFKHKI